MHDSEETSDPSPWQKVMHGLGLAPQDAALIGAVLLMIGTSFVAESEFRLLGVPLLILALVGIGAWATIVWNSGWFSTRGGRVRCDDQPGMFYLGLVVVLSGAGIGFVYLFDQVFELGIR